MGLVILSMVKVLHPKNAGERYPRDSYAKNGLSDVNENAVPGSSANYPNDVIDKTSKVTQSRINYEQVSHQVIHLIT